jgi:hypothetical protein
VRQRAIDRFRLLRCYALLLVAWLAGVSGAEAAPKAGFEPIEIETRQIETFARENRDTTFGALIFVGGLEVASTSDDFGGFSGLDFTPDGALVAVADTGFWFIAHPMRDDVGRLADLSNPRLAPILDGGGKPIAGKSAGDAEALRILRRSGGLEALVSFERQNDLRRFVVAKDLARARAESVNLPPTVAGLKRNAGFEALAVAPSDGPFAGATVLIAEHSLDRAGNHRGWIVGGLRAGTFSLLRSGEFDITDAAFLPDGDLLVLERRLTLLTGPGMRIRRIAGADLTPGAIVDGRILIEADFRHQIDNMEGMAIRPGERGETTIMLISDDNKLGIQRTILLEFVLPADATLERNTPATAR